MHFSLVPLLSGHNNYVHFTQLQGTEIVQLSDQDHTDFTKTVQYLLTLHKAKKLEVNRKVILKTKRTPEIDTCTG